MRQGVQAAMLVAIAVTPWLVLLAVWMTGEK
jgi:hypothetical protein